MHDCAFVLVSLVLAIAVAVQVWRSFQPRRRIAQLTATIDDAPFGILVLASDGTIVDANRGFAELVGAEIASLPGRSLRQFVKDGLTLDDMLNRMRHGPGKGSSFDLVLRGLTREWIETIFHVRPVAPRGQAALFAVHVEDVTERRRMVRSIAERTVMMNAILAASRDGLMFIESTGRIAYANQSFADLFGFDRELLVGETTDGLLRRAADHSREAADALERVCEERDGSPRGSLLPFRTTVTIATTRILLLSSEPVHSPTGEWIGQLVTARDVSQEEKARRARDEFLGNVSHELRTPLTSIAGFVDLLRFERLGPMPERQKDTLRLVAENVTRLSALVGDLLAVGKYEEELPKFEALDLAVLLRSCVAVERENAKQKGLELTLDVPDRLEMEGDPERLRQLFGNLISNAVKYTFSGSVRVEALEVGTDVLSVAVADTGIGIDAGDLPRLYVRFFRADNPETRRVRGTGLGLSIAKVVADQHGGRIAVETRRGLGSTFRVDLPRRRGVSLPAALEVARRPVTRQHHLVLAVDDDTLAHRIIASALKGCGIDVMCAETGKYGIDLAKQHHPDVVLVDLELPDMAGSFVIECLRRDRELARTPIIVISGRPPPTGSQDVLYTAYLQKPVRAERLRDEVLRVLDDETIVCDVLPDDEKGVI